MDSQVLADQVFRRRRELGISQSSLAKLAGISRNYVSMIERGEAQNVSINVLNSLAAALGTSPAVLTGETAGDQTLIPPALRQFALQAGLSFEIVDRLAHIPRRGAEPQTPEAWAALYEAIRAYLEE